MKTPEHPAGPAFEKAADAMEAWRQQQIAALTETQRSLYEEACRKAKESEKTKTKELEERKRADIQERTRKKILETPNLELVLGAGRKKLSEVLARHLTAQYFQPGQTPNLTGFEILVKNAAQVAIREIEQEHAREQEAFRVQERAKTDEMLRSFERARETQPVRDDFVRAGVADKARTDFQEAVRGDGTPSLKSEAIARAIARVKEKEEEEKAREDRDHDRGRSLTDTFNKVR